eukprot:m.77771 g.77771  ORF g.77771 m.77771 type:complete len:95 (-) comp20700_c0_seq2:8-292(-)
MWISTRKKRHSRMERHSDLGVSFVIQSFLVSSSCIMLWAGILCIEEVEAAVDEVDEGAVDVVVAGEVAVVVKIKCLSWPITLCEGEEVIGTEAK